MAFFLNKPFVIGADPGISGAFCIMDRFGIVSVHKNPFIYDKLRYGKAVLNKKLVEDLKLYLYEADLIMIESSQIRMTTNSRKTVSGIWWYAAILDTFFRQFNDNIEYVDPKQWHSSIFSKEVLSDTGLSLPKKENGDLYGQWKQLAKDYTRGKYGSEIMIPKRARNENDGFADAICIAEFALGVYYKKFNLKRTWAREKQ